MILKVHGHGKKILAVCDSDILGKRFEEGARQLDLSSSFYNGEKASCEDLERHAKGAYIINAVGERSVGCLVKLGVADKKDIKHLCGIPYTMIVFD